MLMKLCRRCKKKIFYPKVYCDECFKIVLEEREQLKAKRNSSYNKNRDPKYKEFYNSKDWKILKEKKLLNEQYKCERCGSLAEDVHHKKEIQTPEGWALRLDYDNLEALCVNCHNFRHHRFQKRRHPGVGKKV